MDIKRFDHFTRRFSSFASRRSLVRGTGIGLLGVIGSVAGRGPLSALDAGAKKKKCDRPDNACQEAVKVKGKKKKNGKRKTTCEIRNRADGTSCGSNVVCAGGICVPQCGAGKSCSGQTTCCNNACVDTRTSLTNCGVCGTVCDADTANTCSGGVCQCGAAAACTGGLICEGGTCVCPTGTSICGGACVDLETDNDNCGECGRTCAANTVCRNGLLCEAVVACLPPTSISGSTALAANGGITNTVSADPASFGALNFAEIPSGTTFADINSLIATYDYAAGSCGVGTPRFVVRVDDNGNQRCPYAVFPTTGPCGAGGDGSTGELIGNETPFIWIDDLCGASSITTYSAVLARYQNAEVTRIQLVVDSGNGAQTVTVNACAMVDA